MRGILAEFIVAHALRDLSPVCKESDCLEAAALLPFFTQELGDRRASHLVLPTDDSLVPLIGYLFSSGQ